MKVSIIIPVIRPDSFKRCYDAIKQNAQIPESEYEIRFLEDTKRIGCPRMVKQLVHDAMQDSNPEMVCFLGDDTTPLPGFLRYALIDMAKFPGGWGLVGIKDQKDTRTTPTHWLIHWLMLLELNWEPFHTDYIHNYCDKELQDRAVAMGRYVMSEKARLIHDHPITNRRVKIDTDYAKVYINNVKDRETYLRRKGEKKL